MIFDAHTHFTSDNKKLSCISKRIITIDPFVKELQKPNSFCYLYDKGKKVAVKELVSGKTVYEGEDPYLKQNEILLEGKSLTDYVFILPALTKKNLNNKINFLTEKYGDVVTGVKLYTGTSYTTLDEIGKLDTSLPLLIHTGIFPNQDPKNMLKFLKKYKGKVCLAHFARFDKETLDFINVADNIFVDTCPAGYIFSRKDERVLFDNSNISTPSDLYYKIIDKIGIDKVIWGSDHPYSNQHSELEIVKNLKISLSDKDKLLYKNAEEFLL